MSKFIQADRDQPFLLPPDLREWVPEDDLAHFILEAVERIEMSCFKVNLLGSGSAQYHPKLMLALLIYCYANGLFSSRRIERATHRDIGVRYVAANLHPDHDTIAKFRRENLEAISESFLQVLLLAKELKLLKVGLVSVDGTKIDANASKHRSVRYDRAKELVEQLESDIKQMLLKAEESDQEELIDPQQLPKQLSRKEHLKNKLDEACRQIERQAKAKAVQEQAEYEQKVKEREQREGKRKGKKPKPPEEDPSDKDQTNLTDPDSRLMRKNKQCEYRQAYNAQTVVDAEGSQLVLSNRISQCASDRNELKPDIEAIPKVLGQPTGVLGDSGYLNGDQIKDLQQEMEVLVATGGQKNQRVYDFRPPKQVEEKESSQEWIRQMQMLLESEEGRAKYRLRQQTVEPVFGIIKQVLGFRQFMLRGLNKVKGEWELVTLAYNCKRLHNLILAS